MSMRKLRQVGHLFAYCIACTFGVLVCSTSLWILDLVFSVFSRPLMPSNFPGVVLVFCFIGFVVGLLVDFWHYFKDQRICRKNNIRYGTFIAMSREEKEGIYREWELRKGDAGREN